MTSSVADPDPQTLGACAALMDQAIGEHDAAPLANAFAALSDPTRLRIFSLIASQGEVCSCAMQEPLGKSQPTISHHTKVLAEAGLITGEKRGRWVWWTAVPDRVAELRGALAAS